MPKFSKISTIIFLTLFVSLVLGILQFSKVEGINLLPLVSNSNSEDKVYVCPKATSMEEIYYGCPGMVILSLGETKNGMTLGITEYEGKQYYVISGFESGGAGVLKEAKLETQIAIVELTYGKEDILGKVTKDLGDKTPPLLLSELKNSPIDLEKYLSKDKQKIYPQEKKKLRMKFKFLETAGNEYQGKSINVKFKFQAIQEKPP